VMKSQDPTTILQKLKELEAEKAAAEAAAAAHK
jgi:hypothetical protein